MPHATATSKPQSKPTSKRKARPRWQRRKEARPAEIVSAALAVFVERGFATTKLEEVARRAGVTKGTVYLYFESKEALFKAMVRETIVPIFALGEQMVAEHHGSSADLLAQLMRKWWERIGETSLSGIPKLMMAEAGNFPVLARFYYDEVVSRGHRLMASVLERGIKSGEFRPLDVKVTVKLAMAPLVHAANWRHSFALCTPEGLDIVTYLDHHIRIFLRGIATHPDRIG
jgi:AcrR family transcriptional regulator